MTIVLLKFLLLTADPFHIVLLILYYKNLQNNTGTLKVSSRILFRKYLSLPLAKYLSN